MNSPHLSIFTGDPTIAEPAKPTVPPAREGTLRHVWDEYLLPELKQLGRAHDTLREYRCHLEAFESWCNKYRIAYPVLVQIDRKMLVAYRGDLVAEGHSNRNVNKYLGSIGALLRCSEKHGLIPSRPKLEPLPTKKAARKIYLRYDELDALYRAFGKATWPQKSDLGNPLPYSPGTYWRAALVLYFNYGFRTQELWAFESKMEPLTWAGIYEDSLTPSEEGNAENELGWLVYTPIKQRLVKGDPLVLPLNQACRDHLRSIEPPGGAHPERPVFPCPKSPDSFYDQWDRSVEEAGISPRQTTRSKQRESYHIKHLRKTCTTWHNNHAPGIAPLITGHAERGAESRSDGSSVSSDHYHNGELAVQKAMHALPQPPAFTEIDRFDDRQLQFAF